MYLYRQVTAESANEDAREKPVKSTSQREKVVMPPSAGDGKKKAKGPRAHRRHPEG
jgi:hypothetical protein